MRTADTRAACESPAVRAARALLDQVMDPEIPVLSIVELGIVRHVSEASDGTLEVGLTPTYSGCPATDVIRSEVRAALERGGWRSARLVEVLAPPWSSADLTPSAARKLRAFGIAPPEALPRARLRGEGAVSCPRCGSRNTERLSEFGSTPCKAHHRCLACAEPFDYFKCL